MINIGHIIHTSNHVTKVKDYIIDKLTVDKYLFKNIVIKTIISYFTFALFILTISK